MPKNFVGFNDWMHFSTTKEFIEEKNILSASMYMLTQDVFRKDKFIDKEVVKDIFCVAPKYGEKLIQKFHKESFTCVNIYLLLEHEPSEENRVILDTEIDKFQIPKPKLFYKKTQKSLKTAKFFLDEFANYCLENDLGRIAVKESIFNEEKLDLVGDGGHHMGGTRIGENIDDSVVNEHLLVHGFKNLYINDTCPYATSIANLKANNLFSNTINTHGTVNATGLKISGTTIGSLPTYTDDMIIRGSHHKKIIH